MMLWRDDAWSRVFSATVYGLLKSEPNMVMAETAFQEADQETGHSGKQALLT